ncbi:RNA polymerase sigma factor [Muricoccus radiodurans]|uniref:RNA polymerase sigma factor n=1 Tax=Muricoccus radiodurans TaxID=2231721 RepID=UPI003CF9DD4F
MTALPPPQWTRSPASTLARGREAPRLDPDRQWEGWMAAAQAGDQRAYDQLLRATLPLLRGICRRRLPIAAEVEDAVQDALLTIHRLRHTYDPTRPLRPWVVAIADRRAIDRARRSRHQVGHLPLDEATGPAVAPEAEARQEARLLREAVATLPNAQRVALRLSKLEEMSLAEASAASGMSVGALKVATHRAIASLRRRLGALT